MLQRIKTSLADAGMGVPRSLPLGELLLLITVLCGIFQLLAAWDASGGIVIIIGLLVVGIAVAQALLLGGKQPRAASVVAGTVLCPVLTLGSILTTNELNFPIASETFAQKAALIFAHLLIAAALGPPIGYLSGLFIAGWFYMYDYFRHRLTGAKRRYTDPIPPERTTAPTGVRETQRTAGVLTKLSRPLSPIQPNSPFRGATIAFAWTVLFSGLLCPYLTFLSFNFKTVVGIAALAALVAFATGLFQLRWYILPLILITNSLMAIPVARELKRVDFFAELPNSVFDGVQVSLCIASGALAVLAVAFIGWIVWIRRNTSKPTTPHKPSAGRQMALALLCVVAAAIGPVVIRSLIIRFRQTPRQQFAAKDGVEFWYAGFPPKIDSAQLTNHLYLKDLTRLFPESLNWITINDAALTDESLSPLNGKRVPFLFINGYTEGNVLQFDAIDDITVARLYVGATNDIGIQRLANMPGIQNTTQLMNIGSGISRLDGLEKLTLLSDLSFKSDLFDGESIDVKKPLATISEFELSAPLTDEGLSRLVKVIPNCNQLSLSNVELTAEGIGHLKALKRLTRLSLSGDSITDDVLGALMKTPIPTLTDVELPNTSATKSAAERFEIECQQVKVDIYSDHLDD